MSRLAYSPISIKSTSRTYYGFRGIDRSRDVTALETEEEQNFVISSVIKFFDTDE